ncbi:unnamed protein product, partial [Callosobruchus maculatus]
FISKSLSNERTVYQKVMNHKYFFTRIDKKYHLVLKSAIKKLATHIRIQKYPV